METAFNGRTMVRKLRHSVSMVAVGAVALLMTSGLARAAEARQPPARTALATGKTAKPAAAAQVQKQAAVAPVAQPPAEQKTHRLILQVNTNDAAAMNLTLNNATNV